MTHVAPPFMLGYTNEVNKFATVGKLCKYSLDRDSHVIDILTKIIESSFECIPVINHKQQEGQTLA